MGEVSTAARMTFPERDGDSALPATGTQVGAAAGALSLTCSAWTRSASASGRCAVDRITMPTVMAPVAMKKGTWMLVATTSRPAA
jgi:hypothetical protein